MASNIAVVHTPAPNHQEPESPSSPSSDDSEPRPSTPPVPTLPRGQEVRSSIPERITTELVRTHIHHHPPSPQKHARTGDELATSHTSNARGYHPYKRSMRTVVPQRRLAFKHLPSRDAIGVTFPTVTFDLKGSPRGDGIPASVIYPHIVHGRDALPYPPDWQTLTLRIAWPGYPDVKTIIRLYGSKKERKTRSGLAMAIAKAVFDYIEVVSVQTPDDNFARWGLSYIESGREGITVKDVRILSLSHLHNRIFEPNIVVKLPESPEHELDPGSTSADTSSSSIVVDPIESASAH